MSNDIDEMYNASQRDLDKAIDNLGGDKALTPAQRLEVARVEAILSVSQVLSAMYEGNSISD